MGKKKFIIKEAWLLDENGNKTLKLTELNPTVVFDTIKEKDVAGGVGNVEMFKSFGSISKRFI